MAKLECELAGDFAEILDQLERAVMRGSVSASRGDYSDFIIDDQACCAVRVYERYSALGQNRVSLSITLYKEGSRIFLSAITSGGSTGIFLKLQTLGEQSFLDTIVRTVERYRSNGPDY